MKKQVLVINYHQIDAGLSSGLSAIDKIFSVRKSSFEDQAKLLFDHKIPVVSLYDLVNDHVTADFSVAITCDDGNASDAKIIYPVLKEFGFTATFCWLAKTLDVLSREKAQ